MKKKLLAKAQRTAQAGGKALTRAEKKINSGTF
jgi:hypothetical protein